KRTRRRKGRSNLSWLACWGSSSSGGSKRASRCGPVKSLTVRPGDQTSRLLLFLSSLLVPIRPGTTTLIVPLAFLGGLNLRGSGRLAVGLPWPLKWPSGPLLLFRPPLLPPTMEARPLQGTEVNRVPHVLDSGPEVHAKGSARYPDPVRNRWPHRWSAEPLRQR